MLCGHRRGRGREIAAVVVQQGTEPIGLQVARRSMDWIGDGGGGGGALFGGNIGGRGK